MATERKAPQASEETEVPLPERFPALRRLGRRGRRIPFVQQLSGTECGAACLTMVLAYFGKEVPLEELRETCAVNRDGVNALTLMDAASLYGLRGRAVKVEMDQLDLLEPGTILHWSFNHFIVFEKLRKNGVDIVDPSSGRRRVPLEEFGKQFTGVALLLEPGDGFMPQERSKNRLWPTVRAVLGRSGLLPRILVTSLIVQLAALAVPLLTAQLVDKVVPRSDERLLVVLCAAVGGMLLFDFVATLVRGHLLLHLRTLVDARMTLGFLDHLTRLPYSYFQLRSAGDLMMRLNSNATVREMLTSGVLSGILDGFLVTIYLVVMLIMSPLMAAIVIGFGFANVLVYLFSRHKQRDLAARSLQIEAKSQSYEVEMLTSMETLKSMGAEHRAVSHWSGLFVDVLNASLARGRLGITVEAVTSALRLGSPLCILAIGATLVLSGKLTLGTMLAFDALALGFLLPLSKLVDTALQLELMGRYLERLNDVLDTPRRAGAGRAPPASAGRRHHRRPRVVPLRRAGAVRRAGRLGRRRAGPVRGHRRPLGRGQDRRWRTCSSASIARRRARSCSTASTWPSSICARCASRSASSRSRVICSAPASATTSRWPIRRCRSRRSSPRPRWPDSRRHRRHADGLRHAAARSRRVDLGRPAPAAGAGPRSGAQAGRSSCSTKRRARSTRSPSANPRGARRRCTARASSSRTG